MTELFDTKKDDNLIYDVGLHKGEDTDFYLKKGFRVIAFDANPDLVAQCNSRFSDAVKNKQLTIVHGAIFDSSSNKEDANTIKFYRNKDKSDWGTVSADFANRNEFLGTSNEIIDVPVVDFSECLAKFGIPHYLKIDIEGMDTVCLTALRHFANKPDYVSIESNKKSFEKLIEELDLLVELGYSKFKAVQQDGISRQKEPNPSKEGTYVGYRFQNGSSGMFGEDLPYKWKDYDKILSQYRRIFLRYKLFGDYGILNIGLPFRVFRKLVYIVLRKHLPGWYDTHARHSAVSS
jgi:FkbM family methyltransferase